MISSTPKVAMPGGEPGEAHQRQADDEREDAADDGRERERRDVADRAVAQEAARGSA